MPLAQLQTTIEQEMAENPVIEETPKETREESVTRSSDDNTDRAPVTEELRFDETIRHLDKLDENFREQLYAHGDFSLPEAGDINKQRNYRESLITPKESLFDYLLWQVNFLNLSETERKITEDIIGNLTEDGYLNLSLEDIAKSCCATLEEVEKVLGEIQNFDPPGIAARNLQETLLLQLRRKKGREAELATHIIQDYLPLLEKKKLDSIARHLKVSSESVQSAARVIAHLDPKPGRTFYSEESVAVTPDASVYYEEDEKLQIETHEEDIPELRISLYYRRLLKNGKLDDTSRRFIKEKIQAAMEFIKALSQRGSTLRRITEEIVTAQTSFFEKGFSELKPLRLKDISARLGIHESTVSRAIQGKYLSTPQGTLPYKSFFSSKLERVEGGAESQKSMMEKIRELIRSEDPRHPLSDQTITRILQKQGIKIARRTVAKYRELLRILPSHLRTQK